MTSFSPKRSPKFVLRVFLTFLTIMMAFFWSTTAFLSPINGRGSARIDRASNDPNSTHDRAPLAVSNILSSLPAPVPVPTVGPGVAPDGDPGGFGIEGDLRSNFPGADRSSDWVANPSPTPSGSPIGDYMLNNDGTVRLVFPANGNGNITKHFLDGVGNADQEIFQSTGDKYNDNPATWDWAVGKPPAKNDINHALLHQALDSAGNAWIIVAGDQGSSQGDRYIDFELLQKPVAKTCATPACTSGNFSSAGLEAGRTVGDLLLTVQLSNGGAAAQFFVYRWQASGSSPLGYDYIAEPAPGGNVFIAANTGGAVAVPYPAFGSSSYPLNTFAEGAVNLNALLANFGFNPCIGIKTLFIKTKTSNSPSAQLKDFITPIALEFGSAPSSTITAADVCANSPGNAASVTDAGPGSTYNWTVTNGTVDSGSGTNQITYTAGPSGTVDLSVTVINKAGCGSTTTPPKSVAITPLPTAFDVTGGGAYCTGGAGLPVGLSGSQTGINYQLVRDGITNVGSPLAGTGSALSFGNQTASGTYTVVATGASGPGCSRNMNGSAIISITPLPDVFNVTGGGAYCAGGVGLAVGLSGSQIGINYQLKLGGSNVGSPVAGTGSAISFGDQTAAGTYTVEANQSLSCPRTMSGTASISINALPTAFTLNGGGTYCEGALGLLVGLSGSESGVNYQLKRGGSNVGSPVAGTGSALSFGNQTAAGTYTVVATNASSSCQNNMSGNAVVVVEPNPTSFNVTGGGTYCEGGVGVAVGLSNSQAGVNYQLKRGGSNVGSAVAGTGSALSFGNQTTAGTYTVVATNSTATACSTTMSGNAVVVVEPNPTSFNVTGGGAYCEGGVGVAVGLSGSQAGISYQLIRDGSTTVGSPVVGTGLALNFGNQTAAGLYTVFATNNTASACGGSMNGSASVSIDEPPSVTLSLNLVCDDQGGEEVTQLVASPSPNSAGYSFSWSGPDGPIVDGEGAAITGPAITPTKPGIYSVVVTNTATGCSVSGSFKLCFTGSQLVNQAATASTMQQRQSDSYSTVKPTSQQTGFRDYLAKVFSIFG